MITKFRAVVKGNKGKNILIYNKDHDVTFYTDYVQFWQGVVRYKIPYKNIMQSTGLFDKNGVEIFEGDVIRCTHRGTGAVFLGVVNYDNKYGFWGVTDKRYNDLSAIPSKVTYKGYISETTFCEVIGNIHEHPYLMEVGHDQ